MSDADQVTDFVKLREALKNARCVIVGKTPLGTRIFIIGRDIMQNQLDEIAKKKEVEL